LLKLLADENIPRRLVALLKQHGVDVVRLQDLDVRGISDKELVDIANKLERTILTRDLDFITPSLLSLVKNGVIYVAYQFTRDERARSEAACARRGGGTFYYLLIASEHFPELIPETSEILSTIS